jgi:hypothetical protein
VTVTAAEPLLPPAVARTVAEPVPDAGAVKRPEALTAPAPPESSVQVNAGCGDMAAPNWSLATAENCLVCPFATEAVAGVTLFQRLTVDILVNYFRDDCAGNNQCSHAAPFLGDGLPPIVDSNWTARFAVGYRFYMD